MRKVLPFLALGLLAFGCLGPQAQPEKTVSTQPQIIQCDDMNCFIQAAQQCHPAVLKNYVFKMPTLGNVTQDMEITAENNTCVLTIHYKDFVVSLSPEAYELLKQQGKTDEEIQEIVQNATRGMRETFVGSHAVCVFPDGASLAQALTDLNRGSFNVKYTGDPMDNPQRYQWGDGQCVWYKKQGQP